MLTCGIYAIVNRLTHKAYVGKSRAIQKRWNKHKKLLSLGSHHSSHLQRSWNKHGEAAFDFLILEHCDRDLLTMREQFWLDFLTKGQLYNVRMTSDGGNGGHTEEFKIQTSLRMKGNQHGKGHKHTEEYKTNSSARMLGNKNGSVAHTTERRARMSIRMTGNQNPKGCVRSPETRARMSLARQRYWARKKC